MSPHLLLAATVPSWTPDDGRGWILAAVAVTVLVPLLGGLAAAAGFGQRSPRSLAVFAAAVSLFSTLTITWLWSRSNGEPIGFGDRMGGGQFVHVDGITAVLLPYVATVGLAILLVAPRRMLDIASVKRQLFRSTATLALFSTSHPLLLVALWILTARSTWRSTRATPGGRPAARVYAIAIAAAVACMTLGTFLLLVDPPWEKASGAVGAAGGWLVAVAVMIRKGIVPFHSWYPALFSGAPMSTALAATMPQVAAYTAVRLLIGHADGVPNELVVLSQTALLTAVWGAALAIVQKTLRGLVGTLAMSQSAMVLAGLSGTLPMELNGAFCVWISSGLALTGIGLVTWALESRAGPIRLDTLQGRFWDAPALAAFFLLFGLAAIGLPGTLSFVADDLIVSGSLDERLLAGLLVIASTVLSGIAVLRGWFTVFGGPVAIDGPRHAILPRERAAFAGLLAILFVLGMHPAPLVESLERAAETILGTSAGDSPARQLHESSGDR
jgi:NADH-quinone oxidoreductase subunit M